MKILFLVPYPLGESPSQRFRFEQYFALLREAGHQLKVQSFLRKSTWDILYLKGHFWQKGIGILAGYVKRVLILKDALKSDLVFLHREATPLGPPVFEWIIARLFGKRIIYDFDDAIWIPNTSQENKLIASLKWHSKVASLCKWSWKISCGNEFLRDFGKRYSEHSIVNPTTIDTTDLHVPIRKTVSDLLTIGWTGTHSTAKYLDIVIPILRELQQEYPFRFLMISNQKPGYDLDFMEYRPWTKSTEINDLTKIDIGIMPLHHDPWAEGKCGFKALQYMALEIPVVASPVGINKKIVSPEVGYLAASSEEWKQSLRALMNDQTLRTKMGRNGREKVVKHYSVNSNIENFIGLFRD